jgi:hypothetical protein
MPIAQLAESYLVVDTAMHSSDHWQCNEACFHRPSRSIACNAHSFCLIRVYQPLQFCIYAAPRIAPIDWAIFLAKNQSFHPLKYIPFYFARRECIGLASDAFRAGTNPKNNPTNIDRTKASASGSQESTVAFVVILPTTMAVQTPSTNPTKPPDCLPAERTCSMAWTGVLSAQRELELAKQRYVEDLKSAKAQLEQSAAAVRVLEAQVSYARIQAPNIICKLCVAIDQGTINN